MESKFDGIVKPNSLWNSKAKQFMNGKTKQWLTTSVYYKEFLNICQTKINRS
jgi:hypothetical protein